MSYQILQGDALTRLKTLAPKSVQCCVTSPPYYGLRDYGVDGQIGLEQTPEEYVSRLVEVFREVRRVLSDDGTLWLNLGDSYAGGEGVPVGLKPKDLIGIPWMVAFALRADGYYLRQDIIWSKPNSMPESVKDRCTKAHEYLFLLAKSQRYYYDAAAIKEPVKQSSINRNKYGDNRRIKAKDCAIESFSGNMKSGLHVATNPSGRNKRSVWTIPPKSYSGAHFAVMPESLAEPCIVTGSRESDTVLDPFSGAATVGVVALRHNRKFIGIELNPAYVAMSEERIRSSQPLLASAVA